MRRAVAISAILMSACLHADIQIINGVRYECQDGVCRMVDDKSPPSGVEFLLPMADLRPSASDATALSPRVAQGCLDADAFVAFLKNEKVTKGDWTSDSGLRGWKLLVSVLAILLGGLAMNLTPCVLPMVPVNLMIIGRSAARGGWYGLGIALAYGVLGVAAAVGGLAFGTIQANPYFNLVVALVFLALALSLSGLFVLDFSKGRRGLMTHKATMAPHLFAFVMGVVSAMLAGACVAPILVSVLLLTARLYAGGSVLALALPFVLGLGMALPWPLLGAGLQVLPKPGVWMKWVNRIFALVLVGFAAWYGRLAAVGFSGAAVREGGASGEGTVRFHECTPATFRERLARLKAQSSKPVLVDCWATWCKNCAAMERGTLRDPKVREALEDFSVIRLQAEDMRELKALPGFGDVRGLPAFLVF